MPEILIASLSARRTRRAVVERRTRPGRPRRPCHVPQLRRARRQGPRRRRHPCTLPTEADFDVTRLDADLPGRTETSGIKRVNFDIVQLFVQPMPLPDECAGSDLMAQTQFDAIIADAGFFGILPFLLGDRAARPPMLRLRHDPADDHQPRHGPGGIGPAAVGERAGAGAQPRAERCCRRRSCCASRRTPPTTCWTDEQPPSCRSSCWIPACSPTATSSPTVPEFDYPRSDLPAHVRFVGAVHPTPTSTTSGAAVVGRARRRPSGRARHPGHHRQRRPRPAGRTDDRGARRTRTSSWWSPPAAATRPG